MALHIQKKKSHTHVHVHAHSVTRYRVTLTHAPLIIAHTHNKAAIQQSEMEWQ